MDNIVVLNDNDGNELEFEYLDLIEHNEETYVVLLPVDDEADEVVILKCEESEDDSDEENYRSVDDEALLNELFEIFKKKMQISLILIKNEGGHLMVPPFIMLLILITLLFYQYHLHNLLSFHYCLILYDKGL